MNEIDIAISQEQIDRACEALRQLAEAIHEMCERIVEAWHRWAQELAAICQRIVGWVRDVAQQERCCGQWPTLNRRAPRLLGRADVMRARTIWQWRWSPMYGRRQEEG